MAGKKSAKARKAPRASSGRAPASRSRSGFMDAFRLAFAFGLGAFAASIVFVAVGVALLVGGYVLRNKEQKKPEAEREEWKMTLGLVLMGLGAVVAGGAGLGAFLGEVSETI